VLLLSEVTEPRSQGRLPGNNSSRCCGAKWFIDIFCLRVTSDGGAAVVGFLDRLRDPREIKTECDAAMVFENAVDAACLCYKVLTCTKDEIDRF
jgi:hypothetical protein